MTFGTVSTRGGCSTTTPRLQGPRQRAVVTSKPFRANLSAHMEEADGKAPGGGLWHGEHPWMPFKQRRQTTRPPGGGLNTLRRPLAPNTHPKRACAPTRSCLQRAPRCGGQRAPPAAPQQLRASPPRAALARGSQARNIRSEQATRQLPLGLA